jgi:hypothetical protein
MNLKNLQFHIKNQDYFGTLATVLNLARQRNEPPPDNLIDELLYLQENHEIK